MPLQGYWWVERDNAILTEPTPSHANCLKTRRVPAVRCTCGERRSSSFPKETGCNWSRLRSGRHRSSPAGKAVETHTLLQSRSAAWFPVRRIHAWVAWRLGAMTPFRKLYPFSDRVCPRPMTKAGRRRFRKGVRRLFVVNWLADFSLQLLYISFLERCVGRIVRIIPLAFC